MGRIERKYKQIPEKIVVLLLKRHGRAGRAAAGVADLARILARMEPPRHHDAGKNANRRGARKESDDGQPPTA
jgi:hypothetical protein